MHRAVDILNDTFGKADWTISRPRGGNKKECFVVSHNQARYFLKFDVPTEILVRLGTIGVAPKVVAVGKHEGISYVIQEYIAGEYPDRAWIRDHCDTVAQLMRCYHDDKPLVELIDKQRANPQTSSPAHDIAALEERISKSTARVLHLNQVKDGVSQLQELAAAFSPSPLVPVHGEPNRTNMILHGRSVVFVDWDEVVLGDPLQDTGLVLWWYLPDTLWHRFLASFAIELSESNKNKIYWYAAKSSLEIALWLYGNGHDGRDFVEDFVAAASSRPNPHSD